jgi:hypothetical protein
MHSEFGSAAIRALVKIPSLEDLECQDEKIQDDDLAVIAKMPRLKRLELRGAKVTDAGISVLAQLSTLESLSIWDAENLSDECCRSLGRMTRLKSLEIGWTKNITDKGIEYLRPLADIENFQPGGVITDRGLELIGGFSKLRRLSLGHTDKFTSVGMANLTRLKALRSLTIGFASVDDECLRHLGKITTLEDIDLLGLPFTDAGIQHLSSLRNLQRLYIYRCVKITDGGLASLASRLPGKFKINDGLTTAQEKTNTAE